MNYKRVIIVDPQLKDKKGHNYRYAQGISSILGLPAVLLAHLQFPADGGKGVDVLPVLSFDQYDNDAFIKGFKPGLFDRIQGKYKQLCERLSGQNDICEKESPLGMILTVLTAILTGLIFLPALAVQVKTLITGRGSSAHVDHTALELKAAFETVKPGTGDLVVFQTMIWPTFESLLEMRLHLDHVYNCDALFIVHEDWRIYHTGFLRFSPARFEKRVLQALPFQRSKVVATNQALSDYCAKWTGYPPEVMREIEFPLDLARPEKKGHLGIKRILVPGRYRGDKNFENLGRLVEKVCDLDAPLEFCIHKSAAVRINLPDRYGSRFSVYSDIEGFRNWMKFLDEFDLILLPYGKAYSRRISGIIHEARLLNLPVVCSRDIADASLFNDTRCLYKDDGLGVEKAVSFCFAAGPDYTFYKKGLPKGIEEHLACPSGWVNHEQKPVAVQLKPAWTRCGTTAVLDAQLDYLIDRGWFVIEIYLKTELWKKTADQVAFMRQVLWGGREYSAGMAARVLLKDVRLLPLSAYLFKLFRRRIPAFFKRENTHITWCTPDRTLTRFLGRNRARLALVNHIFNADFARTHIPAERYICETHDIQINQLLRRRPELEDNYDNELNYEMQVLNGFDAVVNLNRNEHRIIKTEVGKSAAFIRPPIIRRPRYASYASLAELLENQSSYDKIEKTPRVFDLLIIADRHPANIDSVRWFVDNVYSKLPQGTSLAVVGTVAQYLDIDEHEKKNIDIHLIGFLDQLCNIYDFCSVWVLPDVTGDGIPIKTDEAITRGRPFVGTEHAFRGYTKEEMAMGGLVPVKNAREMAREIQRLLGNGSGREEGGPGVEKLMELHGAERYFNQWDEVLRNLNIHNGF